MPGRLVAKDITPDQECIGVLGQFQQAAALGALVVGYPRPVATLDKEEGFNDGKATPMISRSFDTARWGALLLAPVACALILATGFANAGSPSLPASLYGTWCQIMKNGPTERYARSTKCRSSDGYLEVGAGTLSGHEWGCKIQRVTIVGRTYELSSKCGGEGQKWDEKARISFDGRILTYRSEQRNEFPELAAMVCRDHRSALPDDDQDPITITLLTFDDTFAVTHVARSGKTYARRDQYRNISVWTEVENDSVNWSGVMKRNPNKRMTGSLKWEPKQYTEKTYDGGRLETTTISICSERP
jgi:hypothetical protein